MSPYSYNSSNELTALPSGSYSYDNDGNTKTKPDGTQYTWDTENRLTQVVIPGSGGTVNFRYDPFGRRIQKAFTQNGTTTTMNYVYDGANLLEEIDQNANVLARYTFSQRIDEPLAELRSGISTYYDQDALGSVTSLSNSGGALANTYTYDTYGKTTASSGTVVNSFQYNGQEFDNETGLRYYRARYYDPVSGRFLSEDPAGFFAGSNFYRYVRNNPSRFIDPSGMIIVVNGTPQDNQNYGSATNYLNGDPGMAGIINDLQDSSTVYTIDFNNNDDDSFDPRSNTINWDPHSGCACTSGGAQSPAMGLGHEMAHADSPLLGGLLSSISIFAGNLDNWEEGRVITGAESDAAHTLGEPTRTDHRCSGFPWVSDPTSHTPVSYPFLLSLTPYEQYGLSAGPH